MAYDARETHEQLLAALKRYIELCTPDVHSFDQTPAAKRSDGGNLRPKILGQSRYLDWARRIYRLRRSRSKEFNEEIFGEPSWDILLDLYIAFLECRKVTIKSACIGSDAPASTALRYLAMLESRGLLHRVDDLDDRRVQWVGLTQKAIFAMNHLCEEDTWADYGSISSGARDASRQREELPPGANWPD